MLAALLAVYSATRFIRPLDPGTSDSVGLWVRASGTTRRRIWPVPGYGRESRETIKLVLPAPRLVDSPRKMTLQKSVAKPWRHLKKVTTFLKVKKLSTTKCGRIKENGSGVSPKYNATLCEITKRSRSTNKSYLQSPPQVFGRAHTFCGLGGYAPLRSTMYFGGLCILVVCTCSQISSACASWRLHGRAPHEVLRSMWCPISAA